MRNLSGLLVTTLLAPLFAVGCSDSNGPLMKPGENCMRCHDWTVAGTVFPCKDADPSAGVPGVTVVITNAAGTELTRLTSNAAGNFYTKTPFTGSVHASIERSGATQKMTTAQTTGACNSCHTVPGQNAAPGRLYIDSAACGATTDVPQDTNATDPGATAFACPAGTCSVGGGLLMQPGSDCSSCHALPAKFAGTVYGPAGETCGSANQGVPGVTVSAIPVDGGAAINLGTTSCVGNFGYQGTSDFGGKAYNFQVSLSQGGTTYTRTMVTAKTIDSSTSLACGQCHNSGGAAGAPVHL